MALISNDIEEEERTVFWKQPSCLLLVQHDLIRQYIPQSLLTASLQLYYLNSNLVKYISSDLRSQLSIGSITIDHLIAVAEYALKSYEHHKASNFCKLAVNVSQMSLEDDDSDEDTVPDPQDCFILWVAYWLACVHTILKDSRDITSLVLSKLKKLPIIPLSNGNIVSIDGGAVFFPPDSDKGSTCMCVLHVYNCMENLDICI